MRKLVHLTNTDRLPLSSNQKRLWIISRQDKENPSYNVLLAYHLDGPVDCALFSKSMETLFERQHTMFSLFRQQDGDPYISIVRRPVEVRLIDLSSSPSATVRDDIMRFMGDQSRIPFDLEEGPLYRLTLLKEKDDSYFFCGVIHHIIFDGYSRSLFVQELSKIYTTLKNGSTLNTLPLAFHSYDFADLEHDALSEDEERSHIEFWSEYLKDCPTELKMPYDYPRRSSLSGMGCRESFTIPAALSARLRAMSQESGSSLFNTLLSLLGVFLYKYTGEKDLCIGVPVANRRDSNSFKTFGLMVNTLPFRFRIDEDHSVREHIEYSRELFSRTVRHSPLSFEKIVEVVRPQRMPGLNPFFQISFSWINNFTIPLSLAGVEGQRVHVKNGFSPFDITFYMWENGETIEGEIEYSTDLFAGETIDRIKNAFLKLVSLQTDSSQNNIRSLSLITEEEVRFIESVNSTASDYPAGSTIVQLFEEQAGLFPDKKAVVYKDDSLTYSGLNEKANRLAHTLRSMGVRADTPVALFMDKSLDMIVATLGILKAGGAYLPVDPEYPGQRVNFILKEAACSLVIMQGKYTNADIECANRLNINSPDAYSDKDENPENINKPSDLAYIMYTSGTTGVPKGSSIEQKSVVRLIRNTNYIEIRPSDRILLTGAIVFDATTFEIWGALLNGAELFVADKETILDPEALGRELIDNDITILWLTSALFTQIAESRTDIFRKLKYFLVGGDVLSASHINKLRRDNPGLKVINGYGPTENTTFSTTYLIERDFASNIPIGKPISNSTAYIFDPGMNYQPVGILGELYVGGDGLSRGYLNREDLNKTSFTSHPFRPEERLYRTGDFARLLPDGNIEFHGRMDNQIKVRGYRIELGEIESAILEFPAVKNCAVKVTGAKTSDTRLICYIKSAGGEDVVNGLKRFLIKRLPVYMIPSHFILMDEMPLTSGGKIDRKALPDTDLSSGEADHGPVTGTEEKLTGIWKRLLKVESIGTDVNFFEAGGTSILVPAVLENVKKEFGISLRSVNVFEYPTIRMMAEYISLLAGGADEEMKPDVSATKTPGHQREGSRDIAVIGIAGRFPGAENTERFWELIKTGKIAVRRFTREELKAHGVPDELLDNPDYVRARAVIDGAEYFEPSFFDMAPREADFMDPQHRLFLEVCYEALEDAGYAPRTEPRNVGVFGGAGINNYLLKSLVRHPDALRSIGEFQNRINNGTDFLTTRVSYKLNLTGPSLDIQTACSTSLVAVHTACQSLLNGECEMALGGGVSIQYPREHGYIYRQGAILSATGNCRPFDESADGTISGEGAAVVLLKRLDDAIRDNDNIYAVIKATAINNDGAVKVGYMAPGLEGQTKVIRQALEIAGVAPESIGFIETHGTGTKLGDPIEISALKKAFNHRGTVSPYCALGAVKANIGHLDAASGVSGLIKAVLVLKHKTIPPLAGFSRFNPELDIEGSPFYATTEPVEWKENGIPRRAAVSSFGIGGTNAHCILEEWNSKPAVTADGQLFNLLPLSARSESSLDQMSSRLLTAIGTGRDTISDIAFTLQTGRETFKNRQMIITGSQFDKDNLLIVKGTQTLENPRTVFMFTGQGSQYMGMSQGLYDTFPAYREVIDQACEIIKPSCGYDLKEVILNTARGSEINETIYAQPALVTVQYATARLLGAYGVRPDILIGHSIGELTAACVSGVMSFHDMLILAARRGEIMQQQERGSMLSVNMPVGKLRELLIPGVEISLINAPDFCVVSGKEADIIYFRELLEKSNPGIQTAVLKTSHAFHSCLMEPAMAPFREVAAGMSFHDIGIPFISNTTGTIIENSEAKSPSYWADHIRKPVNFAAGVSTLLEKPSLFMEVGPGSSLTALLSKFTSDKGYKCIASMRGAKQAADDTRFFLNAIGQYWIAGGSVDWAAVSILPRQRISLPTYPFNRKRHWVDTLSPFSFDYSEGGQQEEPERFPDPSDAEKEGEAQDALLKPVTETQKKLAAIWESYLGVKHISLTDDFFALGGHSLLASQVINRVNEQFNIKLPVDTLFRTSDIEHLETLVLEASKASDTPSDLPVLKEEGFLPVSNEQVRLWMVTQLENNPAYNIPFTYVFNGDLREDIFLKSLNAVFNRHRILKGRIVTVDIEPALVIDDGEIIVTRKDMTTLPAGERYKEADRIIGEDIRKLFDIENDPLYRIYLFKLEKKVTLFHMTIHHIAFDGWSWGVFVRDLKKAYTAFTGGIDSPFYDRPGQYYEFALWQREHVTDDSFKPSEQYWKKTLEGYNGTLNFPYDYPRKEVRSGIGRKAAFTIDNDTRTRLRDLARRAGVTDFVVYISAFSLLLHKYSHDDDLCIGIPSANRLSRQTEGIIGFFVNTLVLRFRPGRDISFEEYVNEAKETIVGALEHQDLPFEKLVEAIQPPRTMNSNPVYQTLFAWLNTPSEIFELPGVRADRYKIEDGVSHLDMTFYIWDRENILEGEVEYSIDLLSGETVMRLISDYLKLLKSIGEDSSRRLREL